MNNFFKHSDKSNTKHIPWFEVKKSQLKDAGWGLYSLQNFENEECIGIYSGFVKKHTCKSTTFSIYEKIQRVDYDTYPWPNEKNCNGNGINLVCVVKWKRKKYNRIFQIMGFLYH